MKENGWNYLVLAIFFVYRKDYKNLIFLQLIEKINVYLGNFLKWIFCKYETTAHNSNDGFLGAVHASTESFD